MESMKNKLGYNHQTIADPRGGSPGQPEYIINKANNHYTSAQSLNKRRIQQELKNQYLDQMKQSKQMSKREREEEKVE